MDAIEFLNSTQHMLENNEEVDYRNAASRAYYCVYHKAEYLLTQHLNQPIQREIEGRRVRGGVHAQLIATLQAQGDPKLGFIGQELHNLKMLRHRADYKLTQNFPLETAQDSVIRAEKLTQDIEEIIEE